MQYSFIQEASHFLDNNISNHHRIIGRHKQELVYSDPNTFSGPDEQPVFDFDDELVVMAKDLGDIRPAKSVLRPKYVLEVSTYVILHICPPQ